MPTGGEDQIQDSRPGADRSAMRTSAIVAAIVWSSHLVINALSAVASGLLATGGHQAARVLVAIAGFALSLLVQFLLPVRARSPWHAFLVQLGALVPATALLTYYSYLQSEWFTGDPRAPQSYATLAFNYAYYLWIFVTCAALCIGLAAHHRMLVQSRQVAEARAQAHQAQLQALRYQLNPHFFFNVLNTLSGLISQRRLTDAEAVIISMAQFLRFTLGEPATEHVPLGEEVAAQRHYLEIEALRFAGRLEAEFDVAPDCEAALVPALILQPLVENVVKHAVGQSDAPIRLRLSVRREGGDLVCVVENSDATGAGPAIGGLGIGLRNVARRLEANYGERGQLDAGPLADGGWRSAISLPFSRGGDEGPDR